MKITDLKTTILSIPFSKPTFWLMDDGRGSLLLLLRLRRMVGWLVSERCMYDWFDDDYVKGERLRFEKGCLQVPTGPGLGVEIDRNKMNQYHEMYKEVGTFPSFGARAEELPTIPVPLWPTY